MRRLSCTDMRKVRTAAEETWSSLKIQRDNIYVIFPLLFFINPTYQQIFLSFYYLIHKLFFPPQPCLYLISILFILRFIASYTPPIHSLMKQFYCGYHSNVRQKSHSHWWAFRPSAHTYIYTCSGALTVRHTESVTVGCVYPCMCVGVQVLVWVQVCEVSSKQPTVITSSESWKLIKNHDVNHQIIIISQTQNGPTVQQSNPTSVKPLQTILYIKFGSL